MSAQQSFWTLVKSFFVSTTPTESAIPSIADKPDLKFGGSRRVSSSQSSAYNPNSYFVYAYGSLNLP